MLRLLLLLLSAKPLLDILLYALREFGVAFVFESSKVICFLFLALMLFLAKGLVNGDQRCCVKNTEKEEAGVTSSFCFAL
jgi:hypothetical protein